MTASEPDARRLRVLFVTFEEGAHGPWRWLQDVFTDAEFRTAVAASVWHVEDDYRGAVGKLRLWRRCAEWLRSGRPDVVCIVHDLSVAAWLAPMTRLLGLRRVLVHSNAANFAGVGGRLGAGFRRWLVRHSASARLAVSPAAAVAMFGARAEPWSSVPACIDFDRLWAGSAAVPASSPRVAAEVRFGFVGRLAPEKNPTLAIRALAQLRSQGTSATLVLVGDGPLKADCESLVLELGLGDAVRMAGSVDAIGVIYRHEIDVLLVPSLSEAQGRVVAEAQMFGLTVLVSPAVPALAALRPEDLVWVADFSAQAWAAAMAGAEHRRRKANPAAARADPRLSTSAGVHALLTALGVAQPRA